MYIPSHDSPVKISTLVELLKAQNFNGTREWVVNNSDGDFESVQSGLFRQIDEIFSGDQSKVQFIVTSQKYQYQNLNTLIDWHWKLCKP